MYTFYYTPTYNNIELAEWAPVSLKSISSRQFWDRLDFLLEQTAGVYFGHGISLAIVYNVATPPGF